MKIRIEFGESKSQFYNWAVRVAKKLPTYKVDDEDGMKVHSVEIDWKDFDTFRAIQRLVGGWKETAYYLDGKLVSAEDIWNLETRDHNLKAALNEEFGGGEVVDINPEPDESSPRLPSPRR